MAELAIAATVLSTVLSAAGSIQQGNAANKMAQYQANQMQVQAGQERASSQRAAMQQRQQKDFAISRARAVAGASGGGSDDPTVVNAIGSLEGQGEYNALTALYEGEDRARGLETGASVQRYQGQQAKQSSKLQAVGTVLSGASSLYSKYAPKAGPGLYENAGYAMNNAGFGSQAYSMLDYG